MDTLVESLTLVKGIEYVLAILFILGFVVFWQVLNHEGGKLALRITLLVAVAPAIWILVFTYAGMRNRDALSSAVATPSPRSGPEVTSAYLADMPLVSLSGMHADMANAFACSTCHHHGTGTQPCANCHQAPFDPQSLGKPGLKGAYHERCIGCHQETRSGPTDCSACHEKAVVSPTPAFQQLGTPPCIRHRVGAVVACLACHGAGVAGAPAVPPDHAGKAEDTCQYCHKPAAEEER